MANTQEITTTDLSQFGSMGRREAWKLLLAYSNDEMTKRAQDWFICEWVTIMFNRNSWNVFLTNEDYQVLMFNNDKLDLFISLPYSGNEWFFNDLVRDIKEINEEDREYLLQFKEA